MTYHEKRNIVTSLLGIAVTIGYILFAINKSQSTNSETLELTYWALWILIFIGIGILSVILGMILFHILYPISIAIKLKSENKDLSDQEIEKQIRSMMKTDIVEDEMGKLISLKSMRIGFSIAGLGFVLSLVALLIGFSPVMMIHIIFVSFSFGSALEGFASIYYYKKGVYHA